MSLADELLPSRTDTATARPMMRIGDSVFDKVNALPIEEVLAWLGVETRQMGSKTIVKCPHCGAYDDTSSAVVAGGVKCLHASCADSGPVGAPGFRTAVDLTMVARGHRKPIDAVKDLAAAFGIAMPIKINGEAARSVNGSPEPSAHAAATAPRSPLRVLSAAEVFTAELTAPEWVIKGLHVGPGRPTLFAGYSYSLKSLLALVTALGAASGQPLWGRFHVRRVRVLILDFEGGDTVLRLRRLAVSMGLDLDDLVAGDWINVAPAPDRFFDEADAVAWLTEACSGFGLVVADSLRQAAPNADENSSEIGVTLAVPTRVSMATGCSFVLVAHSGKTSKDTSKDDRQTATRGSSAIFSQAGNVLHVDRDDARPGVHRVRQRKRPTGAWGPGVEPFTVRVHDDDENAITLLEHEQADDGTDRLVTARVPGLVLELLENDDPPGIAGVIGDTIEDLILAELKRREPQSRRQLSGNLSRRPNAIGDAVKRLLTSGRVTETPRGVCLQSPTQPDIWDDGFDHDL
jgi:hypothetical protein